MGKIDFDGINLRAVSMYPGLLESWLPDGKVQGHEFVAKNPTRADSKAGSFSININDGQWGDFATGDTGKDPVSLYAYIFSKSQGEAAKALAGEVGFDHGKPATRKATPKAKQDPKEKTVWTAIIPVPEDAPNPPLTHYRFGEPSKSWPYYSGDKNLLGLVCRFDNPDGGKEVVPLVFAQSSNGRKEWRWQSFDKPRPMYGLDRLAERPAANVMVVEGEKCADALQALIPELVVVSWPGGGKAVKHADFTPLHGRKCILWPDFDAKKYPNNHERAGELMAYDDQPGASAMLGIFKATSGKLQDVRMLDYTPGKFADGWDVADAIDEGWTREKVLSFVKERMVDPNVILSSADMPPEPPEQKETTAGTYEEYLDPEGPACFVDLGAASVPFVCLGYDHGSYFYLPKGTRQVVELRADGHAQKNLLTLAPLQFWERSFPGRSGVGWAMAANALFRYGEGQGVYDPRRIRGRGAWEDAGRPVLHLGDHLNIDGSRIDLHEYQGRYIYEASAPIDQGVDADPLPAKEAVRFVELCQMLSWEKPINAKLLAGWCVVAPICGALNWRPHIWITGGAGTGKSWVVDNILRPALGPAALMVQSNTTEAGLRQELKHDARPVLFDEAEGEDRQAQARIQNVLELMRQASTENGASILKGSANGKAMSFKIRSSFAFSSIGVNLQQHADASRVTVLSLVRCDDSNEVRAEQFEKIKRRWAEILTPEFCAGMRARAVKLIPVIRTNAGTFSRAAAEHLGSQRIGDQIGAILAGVYALHQSTEISLEDARAWVKGQEWGEVGEQDESRDEMRCLAKILETVVRVEGDDATHDVSIGEAIDSARHSYRVFADIPPFKADEALKRMGIKVDTDKRVFAISNTHNGIRKILSDTPWANNWPRILTRVDGASANSQSVRFAATVSRAVELPFSVLG